MSELVSATASNAAPPPSARAWAVSFALMIATFASTTFVGAEMTSEPSLTPAAFVGGLAFSVPLMAILMAHEFGHFIAGRIHGVDISPPYFIPMPLSLVGTMGAVIRMRAPIRRRNALLDVGAAGPLAGLAVAIPVLVWGIVHSPVHPIDPRVPGLSEGRSALYWLVLYVCKGPIAKTDDVFLGPTAFAGWAGLLVTMINLIPVGQLDGGHVAYSLFGPRQDVYSRRVRLALPALGVAVCAAYGGIAYAMGKRGDALEGQALAGIHWIVWAGVLWVLNRFAGSRHPETGDEPLTPGRRVVAVVTLVVFLLLVMPFWMKSG